MTTPGPQSEARSAPIAQYLGRPVPSSVTFKGMQYRFAYVIDPRSRHRIGPGELYIEPGLAYVAA